MMLNACQKTIGQTTEGKTLTSHDLKGRWVFVNYWADWCKPCMTELPELNQLYLSNSAKILVIGVSFDAKSHQDIQAFADSLSLKFPFMTRFPLKDYQQTTPQTLPTTLVINPNGELVTVLHGPQTAEGLLKITTQ